MPTRTEPTDHWTLDKKIPIAFLIGLAIQGAGIVWYFAKMDARQSVLEANITAVDNDNDRLASIMSALVDRTTRLETDYAGTKLEVSRRLQSIEEKLDRMLEAFAPRRSNINPLDHDGQPYRQKAAE